MTIASNKWPPKSLQVNEVAARGRFTGGGAAANMTVVAGGGRNISSVAYNGATGSYLITFAEVGEYFLGADLDVLSASGTATAYHVHPVAYSASAKTLEVFVTDLATPTGHDLSTAQELWVAAFWSDSDAP